MFVQKDNNSKQSNSVKQSDGAKQSNNASQSGNSQGGKSNTLKQKTFSSQPLADLIRPKTLTDFIGQDHLVAVGKPLQMAITKKHPMSFILWGPPGVGKTTLARIYAQALNAEFLELSAVSAGKADIRQFILDRKIKSSACQESVDPSYLKPESHISQSGQSKLLFLDEIHRFNKAQQDYLLPFVESGQLLLVGSTTENPSFSVINALLSRLRVFVLEPLNATQVEQLIHKIELVLSINLEPDSIAWLSNYSGGDGRQVVNIIESAHQLYGKVTLSTLKEAHQNKMLSYDKLGDEHYNTISAFIKSMRASDPNASLYYLARMVEAGEDPLFIARRMVIFASEDIGMAVPTALVVANEVFQACQQIGYPECQINLAHGTAYLASCKKNRSAYNAYFKALADVREYGNLPIPLHLRNAPTKLMKQLDYGKGYEMYPDKNKSLLPTQLRGKKYL